MVRNMYWNWNGKNLLNFERCPLVLYEIYRKITVLLALNILSFKKLKRKSSGFENELGTFWYLYLQRVNFQNFFKNFKNAIVPIWNNLPIETTNVTNVNLFKNNYDKFKKHNK
ncbi:hypothetical protein BpHYR1_050199 [Brachionus plicatilis]|uniref:RNA-directed DNA polymerase from mobile element jockey-like n=1 Tax=Brachionus plicatilis TaxID=10195 RepID=A0A3M7SGQ4_BRAPC|nr:hypothetical protein BpHYR1_050199 [Brachionus plicatilis]